MKDHSNKNEESFVCFSIIKLIYNAMLVNQQATFKFNAENFPNDVEVSVYSFPSSFIESQNHIEKNGFKTAYEVLNEVYKKLYINEKIDEDTEYYFFHIQFYTEPAAELKKYMRPGIEKFFIFFCSTDEEINGFRILYNNKFYYDYIFQLLDSTYIDLSKVNEFQKSKIGLLEIVLEKICKFLQITIPENIKLPTIAKLKQKKNEAILENFQEFINLVSRGNIEEKQLKKQAEILFKNYQNRTDEDETLVDGHYNFFESINAWNSDWRIDPKDAEYFFSKMIGENLNFEFPEETYNDDLFPYIKSALEKLGFELMSYNTNGDNYLFFIAYKSDVNRILELSELTKIEVDKL